MSLDISTEMSSKYWLFTNNPGRDFMRQNGSKLSFEDTLRLVLSLDKETTDSELIVYTANSEIIQDYNKPRLADHKGYNHMYLNGFADVTSKAFLDVIIQPGDYIMTADRSYESYDLILHCELRGFYYCFRVKSPSSQSMLSSFMDELPDDREEFDVVVKRFLSDRRTNIIKEQKHVYHYIRSTQNVPHFREMQKKNSLVYLSFRVLKIKTGDDSYEYILTNLPHDFAPEDIKECYHLRWGLETAFRYLKHAAGKLHFHSKKPEFIKQEIYARLTIYNPGIFLAIQAADENHHRMRRDKTNTTMRLISLQPFGQPRNTSENTRM